MKLSGPDSQKCRKLKTCSWSSSGQLNSKRTWSWSHHSFNSCPICATAPASSENCSQQCQHKNSCRQSNKFWRLLLKIASTKTTVRRLTGLWSRRECSSSKLQSTWSAIFASTLNFVNRLPQTWVRSFHESTRCSRKTFKSSPSTG